MQLIERDEQQAEFLSIFEAVSHGSGHVVVIAGEAGIGKTALVRQFTAVIQSQAVILSGMCDDLYTPQALAPFYDITFQIGGKLATILTEATSLRLIGHTLLSALQGQSKPVIVVIEDIHWADEATLDLIYFLSRRIEHLRVMLVLTLRENDALQNRRPYVLLGSLPAERTKRIHLSPLSLNAIQELVATDNRLNAETVFQLTRGNPFYITELLASEVETLPHSIRDAVLARSARLSQNARRVLNTVSIVPNHAEEWLIRDVIELTNETLTEVLNSGMLSLEAGFLTFRHELARRAVAEMLPMAIVRELHGEIFQALQAHQRSGIPPARLVHHAAYADMGEAIIELAPEAARQASAVNAHREAAAHYATALRYEHLLTEETQAYLLEARAEACYLGVHWEIALNIYEQALELRQQAGQAERVGDILRRMSRIAWGLARVRQARQYALEAVRTLRRLSPGKSLALAYSVLGQWHMHQNNVRRTLHWSEKAVALAEALHEPEPRIDALTNIGTVLSKGIDVSAGIAQLQASLQLALEYDVPDQAARTFFNLTMALIEQQQLDHAHKLAQAAVTYTEERDLNTYQAGMLTLRAMIAFYRGAWSDAEKLTYEVFNILSLSETRGVAPLICEAVLTCIAARRGAPDVQDRVDNLLHKTQGHLQMAEDAGYIYLPRAEAAWLHGDYDSCIAEAQAMLDLLDGQSYLWYQSCAVFWLWRCGEIVTVVDDLIEPHRLQIIGDWRAAAAAWEQRGYPYEQALALADGDETALREAFTILDGLGAYAAMDYVRKRLRDLGAESVPRGINATTRENPTGLTRRQMDVLMLLKQDLTNAEIASHLHISPKTVEHHVSAILSKLDVGTRDEAVRVARSFDAEI